MQIKSSHSIHKTFSILLIFIIYLQNIPLCAIYTYGIFIMLTPLDRYRKGVYIMNLLGSFIVSVVASIVAYYICRWLSGDKER